MDVVFIVECVDFFLKFVIVEQFVFVVGLGDLFVVMVKVGGWFIFVLKLKMLDEVMEVICQYVGQVVVCVGLIQFLVGVGVKDVFEFKLDLIVFCENFCMGMKMFFKIMCIVLKWYGNLMSKEVFLQIFEDVVYVWNIGQFEG